MAKIRAWAQAGNQVTTRFATAEPRDCWAERRASVQDLGLTWGLQAVSLSPLFGRTSGHDHAERHKHTSEAHHGHEMEVASKPNTFKYRCTRFVGCGQVGPVTGSWGVATNAGFQFCLLCCRHLLRRSTMLSGFPQSTTGAGLGRTGKSVSGPGHEGPKSCV